MKAALKILCIGLALVLGSPVVSMAGEAQSAFNEGTKLYRAGKFKEAVSAYDRAIKASPTAPEPYNNRGLARYKLGQIEAAITDYDVAIKLNPKFTDAYSNRGNAYYSQKQYDRAIRDYDEVIKSNPKSSLI